jgi:hypothetical protein
MGKIVAREFIWFIIALFASLPLGIVFLWFFGYTREVVNLTEGENNYIFWMYITGYLTSFVCIYIMRFVAISIKTLVKKEEKPKED